jgi:hypothetical protein
LINLNLTICAFANEHDDVLTLYSSLPALSAALLRELSAPVLYRQPGVPTQPYFWCEDRDQGLRSDLSVRLFDSNQRNNLGV